MTARSKIDAKAVEARLRAYGEELRALSASSAASQQTVELDQTRVGRISRMDALQVQAMAVESERRRAQELRRVDAALVRIADGEFGYCVSCGEPIAHKRLELDPATPLCIDCASAPRATR